MMNKNSVMVIIALVFLFGCNAATSAKENELINDNPTETKMKDSLLRHVVLFKFKDGTSQEDIKKVENAFIDLQKKIPQIKEFEWGTNNSPEGLNKGLTHCFFVSFESEEDREAYLPHPEHKAFVAILSPHLDDVVVVDYWPQ